MATKAKKLDKYSDLQEILSKELSLNAARIKFIVLLITSLLKVQNVNFERLAQGFDNPVELNSNLRRIQRFFAGFNLSGDSVARLLFKLLPASKTYRLSLDRTNRKFGKTNINILVLGVIYKGMSLPILWSFLGDKRGNSSQTERIELLERFGKLFGTEKIEFVTADREFIGKEWWQYEIDKKIRFYNRMRGNMEVTIPGKGIVKAAWLFNQMPLNTVYAYPKIVRVKDCQVYLTGMRYINGDGTLEYLIIASYDRHDSVFEFYKERWQIETMFKAFKTGGFNLENTHLTDYVRLDKLLMLISIAFHWSYKTGIYRDKEVRKIKIKKHGRQEKSFFSYGLEWIAQAILNNNTKLIEKLTLTFLSCT